MFALKSISLLVFILLLWIGWLLMRTHRELNRRVLVWAIVLTGMFGIFIFVTAPGHALFSNIQSWLQNFEWSNMLSILGILSIMLVAWLCSHSRRTINLRVIYWGLLLQLVFGLFVFLSPQGRALFQHINGWVLAILGFANSGIGFVFGNLALAPHQKGSLGFFLAFQVLPVVIFFAALMGLLYHVGIMSLVIRFFTWIFTRLMRISGAESLSVSSNIFVGIESAFIVRPYYNAMTRSELATVLAGCMATIASTVLAAYSELLKTQFPTIAGHLVSASLLTAPAVIVIAKLMMPETEKPTTLGRVVEGEYQHANNWIESIYKNAMDGARLAVGIGAMLIALIGLLALFNALISWAGLQVGVIGLSIERILSYLFYPFVVIMGVPLQDAGLVANLLGTRVVATELTSYQHLATAIAEGQISPRATVIAAYALCGFAHIPSIAIFVGGIAAIAPKRAADLGALSFRALLIATMACLMTGAVAGLFFTGQEMILPTTMPISP